MLRLGAPGRHIAVLDCPSHAACPGAGFPVGKQRHRRGLVRAVTLDALLEQDGRHVAAEGWGIGGAGSRRHEERGRYDRRPEATRASVMRVFHFAWSFLESLLLIVCVTLPATRVADRSVR